MRWSISLVSPAVVAAGPAELTLGPDADGRSAKVRIALDGDGVDFAVAAEGPDAAVRPAHPEWYNRAHLVVLVNPGHDHATRWLYGVDDAGRAAAKVEQADKAFADAECGGEARLVRRPGGPWLWAYCGGKDDPGTQVVDKLLCPKCGETRRGQFVKMLVPPAP